MCINNQLHRLKDHAGLVVSHGLSGGQTSDYAMCLGSGNDETRVSDLSGACGGYNSYPWDYGSGDYWLELYGGSGRDTFFGGAGHERLCGGSGDDGTGDVPPFQLHGGHGSDDLDGWTGDDYLDGYAGAGDEVWGYDGGGLRTRPGLRVAATSCSGKTMPTRACGSMSRRR